MFDLSNPPLALRTWFIEEVATRITGMQPVVYEELWSWPNHPDTGKSGLGTYDLTSTWEHLTPRSRYQIHEYYIIFTNEGKF